MPRYVGKAIDPEKRFQYHLREKTNLRKNHWIRSLQAVGKLPVLEILMEVPEASWEGYEMDIIEALRNCSYDLTNTAPGGEGVKSGPKTEEHKAKLSAAKKGKSLTAAHCANVSLSLKGKPKPPRTAEHRSRISAANIGKPKPPRTEEHCANISKAQTPEVTAQRAATRKANEVIKGRNW